MNDNTQQHDSQLLRDLAAIEAGERNKDIEPKLADELRKEARDRYNQRQGTQS